MYGTVCFHDSDMYFRGTGGESYCFNVWYICQCVGKLQQKMRTSTAEALSRLDMVGAVRDHRRFNYVCKVSYFF